MKSLILAFTFSAPFWWSASASGCFNNSYTPATEITTVFTGRTPCGDYIRNFLKIPQQANCEMIRWELWLYQEEKTFAPLRFHLKYNYGMNQPNTEDFTGGGNPSQIEGVWKTLKGTKTNSNAIVYQLESQESCEFMSLVKLNDDIIHLLYKDRGLMIGNASWSYTLYKVKD